ncbi:hypothetical protein [Tardiphaga sp. 803_E3_N1_3]|uniref:hypothetical protein n=1 Tax=Tardiphaga sp. 803_E3_N1_3 TaxID=3240785 RepID=UPI003F20A660
MKSRDHAAVFIGMHIIIMPPQFIIIGIPICIMLIMFSQHFMNMSFMAGSIGIISQVMPLAVMVHFIWQPIIGMPPIITGFIMPPAIIGFIMLPDIIGFIMPPIIIGIGIICIAAFIVSLQFIQQKRSVLPAAGRLNVLTSGSIGECPAVALLSKKTAGRLSQWRMCP